MTCSTINPRPVAKCRRPQKTGVMSGPKIVYSKKSEPAMIRPLN
jgi:hypothetical protein